MQQNNEYTHIIVGAGPFGLATAIGLLKHNPNAKVLIREKRSEYFRSHSVRVKPGKVAEFIKVTGATELQSIVDDLKDKPAIRINELESRLKKVATDLGADIVIDPVNNVQQDIVDQYPNAQLIFGTDGVHSTVNEQVFGKENLVKHPFDFVMQIKYEIEGDTKPQRTDVLDFVGTMQAHGVGLDEFIGKTKNGKTTVTTQLMISEEHFKLLKPHADFKNPICLFDDHENKAQYIPQSVQNIIKSYLGVRIATATPAGQKIDMRHVKIVVNEAPATRSQQVVKDIKGGKKVVLLGDAALGLSYFKGVSAAFESCAMFFTKLKDNKLDEYQQWFDQDFAPRKIKETENYSKRIVRPGVGFLKVLNKLSPNKMAIDSKEAARQVELYDSAQQDKQFKWNADQPYPHRRKGFKTVLTSLGNPIDTLKKIPKYFGDYTKPYKSHWHALRDAMQISLGLAQFTRGVLKIALAIPMLLVSIIKDLATAHGTEQRKAKVNDTFKSFGLRIADGLARVGLGITLIMTAPLTLIKLVTRAIVTKAKGGAPKIENNKGVQQLLNQAHKAKTQHEKNALRIDLHRKFEKQFERGQGTKVDVEKLESAYQEAKTNPQSNEQYFRLLRS